MLMRRAHNPTGRYGESKSERVCCGILNLLASAYLLKQSDSDFDLAARVMEMRIRLTLWISFEIPGDIGVYYGYLIIPIIIGKLRIRTTIRKRKLPNLKLLYVANMYFFIKLDTRLRNS